MHFKSFGQYLCVTPSFLWAALLLRLVWLIVVGIEPVSDGDMYREFSHQIANGVGYAYPSGQLTAYWAVGTSAFYGLIHFIFGFSDLPIGVANIAIGVGVVYLSYTLALRYFDAAVAAIAAWLVALWPVLIQFTTVYASELVFLFFLLAALNAWASTKIPFVLRHILWGALLCVATYIRPTALPLFVALPVIDLCRGCKFRNTLVSAVIAGATATALFAPWVIRNQQVFGSSVLVSANFGANLWMGNNPQSNGGYMPLPDIDFSNEVTRDQYYKKEAINFIMENPIEYGKLVLRRFAITYDRETIGVAWNQPALVRVAGEWALPFIKLMSTLYWWLMVSAAIVGLGWVLWRKYISIFNPLVVVPGFFFVVPLLTVGQDRYHMAINPFAAIFAAFAFHLAWNSYMKNKSTLTTALIRL
jgi:4-amino-4-deoxy-L-arabinose transferase-like glycosyltransferase